MGRLTKEARMNLAIQAKKRDPKLSYRKLSSAYEVPYSTLVHRFTGRCARADIIPPLQKLTPTEEKSIVDRILDLNTRAFPVRLQHVKDMANILLAQRVTERVGVNWASKFVKWQKKL